VDGRHSGGTADTNLLCPFLFWKIHRGENLEAIVHARLVLLFDSGNPSIFD
jgi:hypothetical protein